MARQSRFFLIVGGAFLALLVLLLGVYHDVFFPPREAFLKHVGEAFPTVELLSGEQKKLSSADIIKSVTPKKLVVLWASWCEPCVAELPGIQKNISRLKDEQTDVVMINYDGGAPQQTVAEVKAFLVSRGLKLETYYDFENQILEKLQIDGIPMIIALDGKNHIQWMRSGDQDWSQIHF